MTVGNKLHVRSVPKELNTDQTSVLEAVQLLGFVTVSMLMANLNWPRLRAETAIEDLLGDGMLWLDQQCEEWEYWTPAFMLEYG
jgi:ESCRT-II complex subunit VPS22